MSIIQEALKKVQKDVEKRDVGQAQAPKEQVSYSAETVTTASEVTRAADKVPAQTYAPYVILAVIGLTALAFYVIVNGKVTTKPAKVAEPGKAEQSAPLLPAKPGQPAAITQAVASPKEKIEFAPIGLIKDVASIPFGGRPEKYRGLELNGVMYLDEGPRAIINNAIVGEGDQVDGALVKKINRKNVVLSSGGSDFTLDLK